MSATEFIQKSPGLLWQNKLKIYKAINGCLIVAIGGVVASLANENWREMDGQARFLLVCGVLLGTLKALDMYLDQGTQGMQETLKQLQVAHEQMKVQIASMQPTTTLTTMQDLQMTSTDIPKTQKPV